MNARRVAALRGYDILDTEREAEFDDVVSVIARICDVPFAVINFVDVDRQWFKAEFGLGTRELPLDESICAHAILLEDYMEIPDTLEDGRLLSNPLCVGEPNLRFYAGALLKSADGLPLGTLCVLDRAPRRLSDLQRDALKVMAAQVMRQLDLRQALRREALLRREVDHRVKNSLQAVSALARIQARVIDDEGARAALELMQQRIDVIAALHTVLYQTDSGETVTLAGFLASVADLVRATLPDGLTLALDLGGCDITVTSRAASSLGLIVAELVANSQKHGYPDGASGTMSLALSLDGSGGAILHYSDDGRGSAALQAKKAKGLGLSIIEMLAEQLEGQFTQAADAAGYRATLHFRPLL